ncbi:MAG: OB-fold nucleic acid binding domain-containing protein, partial [Candidatus Kapaibacterium sp.]
VAEILKQRDSGGPFTSIFDFAKRLCAVSGVNKRLIESLVLSGAFDSLCANRRQCFDAIDSAIHYANSCASSAASGMESLFSVMGDGGVTSIPEPNLPKVPEWGQLEKLRREKDVLNFYVSGHPLEQFQLDVEAFAQVKLGEVDEKQEFTAPVRACGIISAIRTKLDRRENQIAFVTIEDFTGKAECVFWSDNYRKFAPVLSQGEMVFIIGKAELNGADGIKIIADDVIPMTQARARFTNALAVDVRLDTVVPDAIERTLQLFKNNPGELQCIFRVYNEHRELSGRWASRRYTVTASNELVDGLIDIYGGGYVKLLGK